MTKQIMLDLETWASSPFSTIVAIGACVFDPYVVASSEIIKSRFEVAIDPASCQGMRIDPATMLWWMAPEQAPARAIWLGMPKVSLPEALDGFSDWLRSCSANTECTDLRIWGNGSDFDNALLRQAYEMMKRDVPWSYRHNRCFRTLRSLATFEEAQYLGTQHTALADAENQAIRANQIIRRLGIELT